LEAEAVTFVVGQAVGLDVTDAARDYIHLYRGDAAALIESLGRIQRWPTAQSWPPPDQRTGRSSLRQSLTEQRLVRIEVRRPHVGLNQTRHFVAIESAQAEHVVVPLLLPYKPPLAAANALAAPEPPEGLAP
jgi:hypothetical protein